jgi:hypothetical protein
MRRTFASLFAAAVIGVVAAPAAASPLIFSPMPPNLVAPGGSPFGSTTSGAACQNAAGQTGTNYPGTQVEPWLAVNPSNNDNMIAVWQQDRWSNGGANGLRGAYTTNGGLSWLLPANQPAFSNCTGGSGDTGGYTRASDPWVTIAPNGNAYFMALQADIGLTTSNNNAMSVSRSTDGGAAWSTPIVLKRDTSFNVLNDKNSITADRFNSNFVYAIWDRLEFPNATAARQAGENAIGYRGPTWFSRTTDGGTSWEPARMIFDPGEVNQTIGNQIVQTSDGTLVDAFNLLFNFKNSHKVRGNNVAVIRSSDHGATWSGAKIVTKFAPGTVSDPTTGHAVRTGDIIPEIAADPRAGSKTVYLVWQEATSSSASSVMFSRSSDDGVSWSTPKIINNVPSSEAFTPSIRVGSDGTVTVTYYDFRNDTSAAPLVTDVWAVHSHDGGLSFSEDHVMGPFDMSTAANARGYFTGDYEGLDTGIDPGDSTQFFEAGDVMADGTTSNCSAGTPSACSSHLYANKGK